LVEAIILADASPPAGDVDDEYDVALHYQTLHRSIHFSAYFLTALVDLNRADFNQD